MRDGPEGVKVSGRILVESRRDRTVRIAVTVAMLVLLLLVGEQLYTAITMFALTDIAVMMLAALSLCVFLAVLIISRSLATAT